MEININPSWQAVLADEIHKSYFEELMKNVSEEYSNYTCFPPKELLFSAFNCCSFKEIKVVIIGQDPYHGLGEANGMCFSVNNGIRIPPSLRNIFRELSDDLDTIFMPTSGNIDSWARQGVLLLNSSLTVRKDNPNSHKHLKWNVFTDAVIQKISNELEHIVFLLWGNFAHKKGLKIDRNKHLVLESGHPSPLSANQGKWFGNKHFSKSNNYLLAHNKEPIQWIDGV